MYAAARETLLAAGYRHYEISNFSRPGKECRHNLKYWRRDGYLGLGPSAHGLLFPGESAPFGLRTANPPSLPDYVRALGEGRPSWSSTLTCGMEDAWKESLIFGLRMAEGVSPSSIEKRNGPRPNRCGAVEKLIGSGVLLRREIDCGSGTALVRLERGPRTPRLSAYKRCVLRLRDYPSSASPRRRGSVRGLAVR